MSTTWCARGHKQEAISTDSIPNRPRRSIRLERSRVEQSPTRPAPLSSLLFSRTRRSHQNCIRVRVDTWTWGAWRQVRVRWRRPSCSARSCSSRSRRARSTTSSASSTAARARPPTTRCTPTVCTLLTPTLWLCQTPLFQMGRSLCFKAERRLRTRTPAFSSPGVVPALLSSLESHALNSPCRIVSSRSPLFFLFSCLITPLSY